MVVVVVVYELILWAWLLPFQALSERFSGEITDEPLACNCFFPDEYFTCSSICLSCG